MGFSSFLARRRAHPAAASPSSCRCFAGPSHLQAAVCYAASTSAHPRRTLANNRRSCTHSPCIGSCNPRLFGVSAWEAFFHWVPLASQALLSQDHAEWYKLQSLFALVRMLGGGAPLAWGLQLALTALTACALCAMWWNTRIPFELKAAAAAVAVPLATPYVYLYDLTVLGVSVAFLLRCALATGFMPGEVIGLASIRRCF